MLTIKKILNLLIFCTQSLSSKQKTLRMNKQIVKFMCYLHSLDLEEVEYFTFMTCLGRAGK